jgi:hypothetical protein
LLQHLVRFCSGFPKFKTKLYTDKLLSQVSHHKTANSRKHNNVNTFNNKRNHLTRRRLPHWFKKGVWRDTYRYFDVLITIRAKFKFQQLLDRTTYNMRLLCIT